jgi:uncharacterized protein (TIGR03790 family)
MKRGFWLAACLLAILRPSVASAQTADNVLLVINDSSPASVQIGEYYARKRSIAQDHIVHLKAPVGESIARNEYEGYIAAAISNGLIRGDLQDKVLYIVLTKGIPLRITGTEGRDGTVSSVDSELTLLYRRMVGEQVAVAGRIANPYYLAEKPVSEAKLFSRLTSDIYLVTRLDGFSVDDVLKLIDRGSAPVADGKIVLDQRAAVLDRAGGDQWLAAARDQLTASGAGGRVVFDSTRGPATADGPVIGYYSWGSNDGALRTRDVGLDFAPGSIGGTFVSSDGRTFTEPPKDWVPGPTDKPLGLFGSGSQSLAGDLIRRGLTGASAHVAEPFIDATIRPQVLFPAYLAGFNLAESFYLAMPYLSWETVILGDPLCAPFPRAALDQAAIHKGIDADTQTPAVFGERRLAVFVRNGFKADAVKLVFTADALERRGDAAAAEPLLVQATDIEPRLLEVHLRLAGRYEARDEHDKAIARYRKVLEFQPLNVIALNNLAYDLAVYEKKPAEALGFAQRAYALTAAPSVLDTLGWVHHLSGDDRAAATFIERATAIDGKDVDILVHAAVVHEALNDRPRARAELDAAVKLDPKLAERADVKALRARLK